jgi:hypothetical protein
VGPLSQVTESTGTYTLYYLIGHCLTLLFSVPASSPTAKSSSPMEEDQAPARSAPVKRKKPSALLSDDEDESPAPPKKRVASARHPVSATPNGKRIVKARAVVSDSDDDEVDAKPPQKRTPAKKAGGKTKSVVSEYVCLTFVSIK